MKIGILKPEEAARKALANVAKFKKEQARKALEAKVRPPAATTLAQNPVIKKPAQRPPATEKPALSLSKKRKEKLSRQFLTASEKGDKNEVERLLKAGADMNARDEHGFTALIWAALNGNNELAQMLIDAGADLNVKSNLGNTALSKASEKEHDGVVRLLIAYGAEVNIKGTKHGETALMWAATMGNVEIARLLINAGADVNAEDVHYKTALIIAVRNGHPKVAALLRAHGAK